MLRCPIADPRQAYLTLARRNEDMVVEILRQGPGDAAPAVLVQFAVSWRTRVQVLSRPLFTPLFKPLSSAYLNPYLSPCPGAPACRSYPGPYLRPYLSPYLNPCLNPYLSPCPGAPA